jgi:hypothetical protein
VSDLLTVRYPSGATEFRVSGIAPAVGDVLVGHGGRWVVEAVEPGNKGSTVVTVRPDPGSDDPGTAGIA